MSDTESRFLILDIDTSRQIPIGSKTTFPHSRSSSKSRARRRADGASAQKHLADSVGKNDDGGNIDGHPEGSDIEEVVVRSAGSLDASVIVQLVSVLLGTIRVGFRMAVFAIVLLIVAVLCETIWPYQEDPQQKAFDVIIVLTSIKKACEYVAWAYNIAVFIFEPLFPLWNSMTQYVFQPIVFISIEIVSLLSLPF
jgi:hypothetical protein